MSSIGFLHNCVRNEVGFIGTPDTVATLEAIYAYVQNQRKLIPQFPDIKPLIESFEAWYQAAGPMTVVTQSDIDEAKRRRYAINKITGNLLPDDVVPFDSPQTPPDEPKPLIQDIWQDIGGPSTLGFLTPLLVTVTLFGVTYLVLSRSSFKWSNR